MMCVFLLSSILKMGKLFVSEEAEEEFMLQCRTYSQTTYAVAQAPPAPRRTFERFWESRYVL
jgi:calcium release-activated calcium channel protein 1